MLKKILFTLLIFNFCSISNAQVVTAEPQVTSRILVKWKVGKTETQKRDVYTSLNCKKLKDNTFHTVITSPSRSQTNSIINQLRQRSDIETAEPDYYGPPQVLPAFLTPNDSLIGSVWQLTNLNVYNAWNITTGTNIKVATADSGVQINHPDLLINQLVGYNVVSNNTNTDDIYGHGTAVAGCISADTNNSLGIASPGWNVKHLPLLVSDNTGYAYWSTLSTATKYAADNGVKVMSTSFEWANTTTCRDAALYLWNKGGILCVSAGNQSTLFIDRADNPYALVIGATDSANNFASFSNRGPSIDVVAPGSAIYTTSRTSTYGYWSGTSFSSPLAASVISMMYAVNPTITPQVVTRIIKSTATDIGSAGHDLYFSWGLINAQAAVQAAKDYPLLGFADNLDPKGYILFNTAANPDLNNVTGTLSIYSHFLDNFDVKSATLTLGAATLFSASNPTTTYNLTSIDTTKYANGTYTLTLTTTDTSNRTHVATQNFTIANAADTTPPTVSLTAPANGATVSGTITVSATASDNVAVNKVSFYVDNVLFANVSTSPYSTSLNTNNYSNGTRVIKATAFDNANNQTSSTASVTFSNVSDTTPPTISITSPASGTKVRNTIKIYVNASDNVGVTKVELYVDGSLASSSSTAPFTTSWNPKQAATGNHTIYCKAYDAAGNTANSASIVLVK